MKKQLSIREEAGRIAEKLSVSCGQHSLGIRFGALVADTYGLLRGIENGNIERAQPRIRDNIIELITICEGTTQERASTEILNRLRSTVSEAAYLGLTAGDGGLSLDRKYRLDQQTAR